jgi:hypothetical protein
MGLRWHAGPAVGETEFEPLLHETDLGAEVANLRLIAAAEDREATKQLQPRIDGHLRVCEDAIDELIAWHRKLVDQSDLDLSAATRWVAIWELSGRCLGISKLVIYEMRGGFTSEAAGTLRTLHEAVHLLTAVSFTEEDAITRRWLDGDYVRPREARDAMARQAAHAQVLMREAGIEPEETAPIEELGRQVYDVLSRPAHHRRGGFDESISRRLRLFVYGPHPSAQTRATHVLYAGELIEEVLITVGGAFGSIFGAGYYREHVKPLQETFAQVRSLFPLDEWRH